MARRVQTQFNPPTQDLQPVAAPQSRPFVPRLPQDILLPVQELAGLSQTLSRISVQQAERENEVARQQGLDAAAGLPADAVAALVEAHKEMDAADGAQRANQEAFAKAMREGKVDAAQNPWVAVGFRQGAAHRLMAGYDAKLNAAMAAATATQDANGDPVVPKSPDAVIAEVWGQYKDNPVLKDYYGSKVALQMKAQADDAFTSTATKTLAENQIRDTVTWATNSLTDKMFGLAVSGQDPTPETWTEVRAWAEELRLKTGGRAKSREIMLDAAKGVASRLDAADSGESGVSKAAQFLRDFGDAPVGSTTLGKDAVSAPEMEALIDRYESEAKTKAESIGRTEKALDAKALDDSEREFYAFVDKRREQGPVDMNALADEFLENARGTPDQPGPYAGRIGLVADNLKKQAFNSANVEGAVYAAQLLKELDASGNPTNVAHSARMLRSAMDEASYRSVMDAVEKRTSVQHLIERSPLALSTHKDLDDAATVPGIPDEIRGEVGVDLQASFRSRIEQYRRDEVSAMVEINALPEEQQEAAQRKWHQENASKLKEALRSEGLQFTAARAKAFADIQDALDHGQSAEKIIQANADKISEREVRAWREKQRDALDYQSLTRTDAYRSSESFVLGEVANKYQGDADVGLLIETGRRTLEKLFVDSIGETLAGTDPAKKNAAVAAKARELSDLVLQEVASKKLSRFQEAAQPGGETVEEAKAAQDAAALDLETAKGLLKTSDHKQFAAALVTTNPAVPQTILDYQSAFLRATSSPGFGSELPAFGLFQMVERRDVENRIDVDGLAAVSDPALSPAQKAQAIADMMKVTGIPAQDLLDGKIVLRPSADWRAKAEKYLQQIQGVDDPRFAAQRKLIRDQLAKAPTEFPTAGVKIAPYTTPMFDSEAEVRLWHETRNEDLRALAKKYGVPTDDDAFEQFVLHQIEAVKRLNQER